MLLTLQPGEKGGTRKSYTEDILQKEVDPMNLNDNSIDTPENSPAPGSNGTRVVRSTR